jgi:hypothetical protein
LHDDDGAAGPGAKETGEKKLTGKLLEALSLLCQAGEKLMSCMGESQQQMIESVDPAEAGGGGAHRERGRPVVRDIGCVPVRDGGKAVGSIPAVQGVMGDAISGGEDCRGTGNSIRTWGRRGSPDECEGLQHVVVLTPECGQLINLSFGGSSEFNVVSQKAAARYGVDRTKLQTPLMLEGPSGAPRFATEICTIAFPHERAVGGKMMIYGFVVDKLEEYCEVPQGGLQRWQMQLGADDDGFLQWLRVAQPGDRLWCKLTLDGVTLNPEGVSRSTWKFLVCKGRQMIETVWLTAARAWGMPVSRISAEATVRLGLTEQPNEWCQVRPCNATGRQEDGFLAKIASELEIAPPGYPTTRRPLEENFRWSDVVIGTRDWERVERFLCDMRPDEIAGLRETRKQHVRIVLQDGERWHLNLLVSETAQRSRITSMAAAKLGRGSVHDKHMHLRDVNGREVPITVDVVDTTKELVAGECLPPGWLRPHLELTPGDEQRIQGVMLPGWMGKADLLKGWAIQGRKKDQSSQEARGREVGEQACFKHLKVKIGRHMLRITVLFNKSVPNTVVGYGEATRLNLKGGRADQEVTTADGRKEHSYAWYHMPLLDTEGRTRLVRASGVVSTTRIKIRGKSRGACGDFPYVARRGHEIHLGMGVRRHGRWERQHGLQAGADSRLAQMARGRLPPGGHGIPRALHQEGTEGTQQEELGGSRTLIGNRQGFVLYLWCEHFYRLPPSPLRYREKAE